MEFMLMPGMVKRKYNAEIARFNKSLKQPLNKIAKVLPYNYTYDEFFTLFKELYPYEWDIINQRYKHYVEKDNFLASAQKKKRYKPTLPSKYLLNLPKVKHMLSNGQQKKHQKNLMKITEKNY